MGVITEQQDIPARISSLRQRLNEGKSRAQERFSRLAEAPSIIPEDLRAILNRIRYDIRTEQDGVTSPNPGLPRAPGRDESPKLS